MPVRLNNWRSLDVPRILPRWWRLATTEPAGRYRTSAVSEVVVHPKQPSTTATNVYKSASCFLILVAYEGFVVDVFFCFLRDFFAAGEGRRLWMSPALLGYGPLHTKLSCVWRSTLWKRSRVQCWEERSPESHCPGQLLGSAGGFVGEVAEKCANPWAAMGRDCNCSYHVLRWRSRHLQPLSMWCWRLAATYCFSYRRRQFLV